jgi:hypothetical protein
VRLIFVPVIDAGQEDRWILQVAAVGYRRPVFGRQARDGVEYAGSVENTG